MGCAATGNEKITSQPDTQKEAMLLVGVTADSPPLIYKQGDRVAGLEAELASALAESLGKSVRFVELGWKNLIPALLENRIDIIMSGMSITEMREVRIAFTSPYLRAGQMALVRGEDSQKYPSAASIKKTNRRVGFIKGTTGDFLVQKEFQLARKRPFSSSGAGVQAMVEERIDFFIHDAPVIWWLASEKEVKGLTPLPILLTEEYLAWGIRKDDTKLLKSANTLLETWKNNGNLRKLIKRWMPYAPDESMT
jgi:ABC-type amino acid transport substrate-binding protein